MQFNTSIMLFHWLEPIFLSISLDLDNILDVSVLELYKDITIYQSETFWQKVIVYNHTIVFSNCTTVHTWEYYYVVFLLVG